MIYEFNADYVLEMAATIEKNGARFYQTAAQRVTDQSARTLLKRLADEEREHELVFASMKEKLSAREKTAPGGVPKETAALYLKALADTHVFFEKELLPPNPGHGENTADLLRRIYIAAIRAEKDSIVFYVGLKEVVPERFGRERVDQIIQEEMVHLTTLSTQLARL